MNENMLTKRIIIKPSEFTENITDLIKQKIKNLPCTKDYGYVIDILKILSYESMISRNNGYNIVTAQIKAHTFLPIVGLEIDCIVNMIFPQCIFATFINIKIVIPVSELEDFTYENQQFKNADTVIQIGDSIKVKILNTRFKQKNFSCIAKLKI
jgi:DNA-directed RNA polymerase subunit E'/Rpb7